MTLTEKQTKQAQDLIEKYGFCTLETQKELAKAGFFEKQVVVHYIVFIDNAPETIPQSAFVATQGEIDFYAENDYHFIFMPQMQEVWKGLPKSIKLPTAWDIQTLSLNEIGVYYNRNGYADDKFQELLTDTDDNFNEIEVSETEAMCRLWLLLHKEGLL